jgi:hypothetical protein
MERAREKSKVKRKELKNKRIGRYTVYSRRKEGRKEKSVEAK